MRGEFDAVDLQWFFRFAGQVHEAERALRAGALSINDAVFAISEALDELSILAMHTSSVPIRNRCNRMLSERGLETANALA